MNLNIVTFYGTLATMLRWVILIVMLYNVIVSGLIIRRYARYGDSVNRMNLPHHTYIERVGLTQAAVIYLGMAGMFVIRSGLV